MDTHLPLKQQTDEQPLSIDHASSESNRLLPSNGASSSSTSYLHELELPVISYKEEENKDADITPSFAHEVYGVIELDEPFDDDSHTPPFSWKKLWLFTGPGILMSIAFLDPGNL